MTIIALLLPLGDHFGRLSIRGGTPAFSAWFTAAFDDNSAVTTSRWPYLEAIYKGVASSFIAWFTAAFDDNSAVTTSRWPSWEAIHKEVAPAF